MLLKMCALDLRLLLLQLQLPLLQQLLPLLQYAAKHLGDERSKRLAAAGVHGGEPCCSSFKRQPQGL